MKKMVMAAAFFAAITMMAGPALAGIDLNQTFDRMIVSNPHGGLVAISMDDTEGTAQAPKAERKSKIDQEKIEGWGGFGGVMIQYIELDVAPLEPMTKDRGLDEFDDQMLLIGGLGGFIYKDFRMGGYGMGNSQEVSDEMLGKRMSAHLSMGGGGIFMELNHAFNPAFGLAAGTLLGAGSINLEASGPDLGPEGHWEADSAFFMANPYLGFWVSPVKWMWVQANAGYLYFQMDTSGSDFENELGMEMVDDDLTGGFSAMVTINFGYNPNL